MPCPTGSLKSAPAFRLHKPSGRAVVTLSGRDVYLRRYGTKENRRICCIFGRRLPKVWPQLRLVARYSVLAAVSSLALPSAPAYFQNDHPLVFIFRPVTVPLAVSAAVELVL